MKEMRKYRTRMLDVEAVYFDGRNGMDVLEALDIQDGSLVFNSARATLTLHERLNSAQWGKSHTIPAKTWLVKEGNALDYMGGVEFNRRFKRVAAPATPKTTQKAMKKSVGKKTPAPLSA